MDLQQLRYIVALSSELNFNQASRKVGISQPTLSQQIKKLEEELGEPLFERSSKSVKLTSAGEKFIPLAIGALEAIQNGIEIVKEKQNEITGHIKLATIPTIGPYLLPEILKKIKKKAPALTLELYEETTSLLIENLKNGKFDLAVLALPIKDSAIISQKISEEEFFLAVASEDPLASKKSIHKKDILNRALLILQEGHCFRDQALDFCQMNSSDSRIIFEGSSLLSILNLVSLGEGITLVPKIVANSSIHRGLKYIPFQKPKPKRELGIVWRKTTKLNKNQRFLIDIFKEILSEK